MRRLFALVMAGGKGGRLKLKIEKPMLEIDGVPMVKRVIDACLGSPYVERIFVAVSDNTPVTRSYVESMGLPRVTLIRTQGDGYHEDMKAAIVKAGGGDFLVLSADIPFLSADMIDHVASSYFRSGKQALSVVVPRELLEKTGLKPTSITEIGGKEFVPCAVNIVDGSKVGEDYLEEETLVIEDPRVCANINTCNDLDTVRRWGSGSRQASPAG